MAGGRRCAPLLSPRSHRAAPAAHMQGNAAAHSPAAPLSQPKRGPSASRRGRRRGDSALPGSLFKSVKLACPPQLALAPSAPRPPPRTFYCDPSTMLSHVCSKRASDYSAVQSVAKRAKHDTQKVRPDRFHPPSPSSIAQWPLLLPAQPSPTMTATRAALCSRFFVPALRRGTLAPRLACAPRRCPHRMLHKTITSCVAPP